MKHVLIALALLPSFSFASQVVTYDCEFKTFAKEIDAPNGYRTTTSNIQFFDRTVNVATSGDYRASLSVYNDVVQLTVSKPSVGVASVSESKAGQSIKTTIFSSSEAKATVVCLAR